MGRSDETLLQVDLTPDGSITKEAQHSSSSSSHPMKSPSRWKITDSSVTPGPQFHSDTLRQSMLGTGLARSRSEAHEDTFGVSRDRTTHGGFGVSRSPKPLNTVMYMPQLGLSGRSFSAEVGKSLSSVSMRNRPEVSGNAWVPQAHPKEDYDETT